YARIASPNIATAAPMMMDNVVGCANQMYAAAKRNPSGTRIRRAILFQLDNWRLQQLAGCGKHLIWRDIEQAGIEITGVRKRSRTGGISQHDVCSRVWAVAGGVSGAEDRDYRNAQRSGKMHG